MKIWVLIFGNENGQKRKPAGETLLVWRDALLLVVYGKRSFYLPEITYYDPGGNERCRLTGILGDIPRGGHWPDDGRIATGNELLYIRSNSRKTGLCFDHSRDLAAQVRIFLNATAFKDKYKEVFEFYKTRDDYSDNDVFGVGSVDFETAAKMMRDNAETASH